MNVYKFPFDKQTCSFVFGSWFQNNQWITFYIRHDSKKYFLDNYVKNPVWEIVDYEQRGVEDSSRILSQNTSDTYFEVTIKRGPLYYMINTVYPCLILNVVTLLTFFLPFALQATISNKK